MNTKYLYLSKLPLFCCYFHFVISPLARRPGHNPLSGEWLVLKLPGGDPRNLIFISRADLRQTLAEALKNFKLNRRGQFLFHVRLAQNVNRICGQDFEFWKYGLRIFWLWTSVNILIAIIKDFIEKIVLKMSLISIQDCEYQKVCWHFVNCLWIFGILWILWILGDW